MARKRVKAAARKAERGEAHLIADGVFHVAREMLEGVDRRDLPLPLAAWAPLVYATEMLASVACQRHGIAPERQSEVAFYLLAGINEVAVAAFQGFDVEHFERWTAAMASREGVSG